MSKQSVVTARERPVKAVASQSGGELVVHGELLDADTTARVEIVDLTERVMDFVRQGPVSEGTLSLWSMHTTCALFINESQPALAADILEFLETAVARQRDYRHNDPRQSDCDRTNADSHLRAMLLGHSLSLQISGGEVVLGRWQRVLMAELDGPRTRTVRAQVMGLAERAGAAR